MSLVQISATQSETSSSLWSRFVIPADSTKTKVWWFHGETVTTEQGIDADLQAFKEKGVGGVIFYDQVHGKAADAYPSMSPEWWAMLKYAAGKAKSLGLTFEVAASNGYVAGGPWISSEYAMKKTVWSDTLVTLSRPKVVSFKLPVEQKGFRDVATVLFPDSEDFSSLVFPCGNMRLTVDTIVVYDAGKEVEICGIGYQSTPRGKGSTGSMNISGTPRERYFGAKYMEYPPFGQLEYSNDGISWESATELLTLENNIGYKSRRRTISFPSVKARYFRLNLHDWHTTEGDYKSIEFGDVVLYRRDVIDNLEVKIGLRTEVTYPSAVGASKGAILPSTIIDISDRVDADGNLSVDLGAGSWRIIRFGYAPTGAKTKHGRKNLIGYEADVMSATAAGIHYDNYFKAVLDTLAKIDCPPIGMCMDSHEAGTQNWTQGFEQRFAALRGYELTPWIPALAGYIVGDRDASERMLSDFRRSVAETITDEFYGTLARRCRADGVDFTSQAMLNILTDNISNRGKASKPQGEFWTYQTDGNYDCLDAASSAHLYGHLIASGEAFTDTPYETSWDELLRIANIAYCRGINEFAVCASSYQPWLDRKYDDSASSHPYVFHRLHPKWDESGEFWTYQARCAGMLREGKPVVDLCVYIGENPPLKTFAYRLPLIPEGYNFDVSSRDALMSRMSVAPDGDIAVESGMTYRAVLVEERTQLSPEVERKLEAV